MSGYVVFEVYILHGAIPCVFRGQGVYWESCFCWHLIADIFWCWLYMMDLHGRWKKNIADYIKWSYCTEIAKIKYSVRTDIPWRGYKAATSTISRETRQPFKPFDLAFNHKLRYKNIFFVVVVTVMNISTWNTQDLHCIISWKLMHHSGYHTDPQINRNCTKNHVWKIVQNRY
jgi:hypothetical protein